MAAISLIYEFPTTSAALDFVKAGTAMGLMISLRDGTNVHIITTTEYVEFVNHLARSLGGIAVG